MDDILELILTILLLPFRSKQDELLAKINRIESKSMRIIVKTLIFWLLPFIMIFGLCALCSYLFRGYWI